jgi:phosphomannomutase
MILVDTTVFAYCFTSLRFEPPAFGCFRDRYGTKRLSPCRFTSNRLQYPATGLISNNLHFMSTSIAEEEDETSNHSIEEEATFIAAAKEWISYDPNLSTAQYVQQLIDTEAHDELQSLFPDPTQRIAFGTAGLRGKMHPGPLYMNDLVVIQTAQGIASYCKSCIPEDTSLITNSASPTDAADVKESNTKRSRIHEGVQASSDHSNNNKWGIVIGYDHRATSEDIPYELSSLQFALYTTLVFQKAGFHDVLLLDGYVATPLVPFTVVRRGCVDGDSTTHWMGIMITASHNPKEDAGYKIYRGPLGCQIQSPTDQQIAQHIRENTKPWMNYREALEGIAVAGHGDPCRGFSQPQRTRDIVAAYFDALVHSGLCTGQGNIIAAAQKVPNICYTAMHGVGYNFARQVFSHFGLPKFHSVPIQQEPNPEFPTVLFPNPEEKGALDMAKLVASTRGCNVVLANDPDADRLAVAEYDGGRWTEFTGDQIGAMLGHWLWQTQSPKDDDTIVLAMCASTVSSRLLSEMARVEGFYYEDTLTGFKWIGSRAATLHGTPVPEQPGKTYRSIFCYEEAIGFCCGNVIFDKDGISALAVFSELCYSVYRSNRTISQHLQSLYDRYGEFVSNNGYFFVSEPIVVTKIMDAMTNNGKFDTLDTVGPYKVASVRYLGVPGYDSSQPDRQPLLPCSKSSPMMTIRFENGCIAQFRGSGTEPKLKYYLELPGTPGIPRHTVAQQLEEMSEIILEALLQPEQNGLRRTRP